MIKKYFSKVLTGILVVGMLASMTACGSKSDMTNIRPMMAMKNESANYDAGYYGEAVTSDMYYDEVAEYEGDYSENGLSMGIKTDGASPSADMSQTSASKQKLIRTVSMEVETKEYDEMMNTLQNRINELNGYIEYMDNYNGSNYSNTKKTKNATLTIRIPKQKLDLFLASVSEVSNVVRRSENVTNVTLNYLDTQSQKEMLLVEQERMLALLERAEELDDIITLEKRLTEIRRQVESLEKQLRSYDDQVDYSTVHMTIREVKELTVVVEEEEEEEPTTWERISKGFEESLKDIGAGFTEFFVWFVVTAPYLVLWGIVIFVGIVLFKANKKRIQKKKAKRAQAYAASPVATTGYFENTKEKSVADSEKKE